HARALASRASGTAQTAIHMLHNTPYGDIVDTEDDLQPVLYEAFEQADRVLKLMHAIMRTLIFNRPTAQAQAHENMIVITEFADVLTRDYQVPFRKAHQYAAKVAQMAMDNGAELANLS